MKVPTITLTGDPYAMGLAHGKAMARQIAAYTAERVALAGSSAWTGRDSSRTELLDLATACLELHEQRFPRLVEELAGVAAGSGTGVAELLIAGGFTDFVDAVAAIDDVPGPGEFSATPEPGRTAVRAAIEHEIDDCTAFLVPAGRMALEAGTAAGALAQTWDMHEGSAEHLVLLEGRPDAAPDFIVYTTAGCVGMIGINEAGVSVGINNLMAADGGVGLTWPFVVRAMLEQESAEEAMKVLLSVPLAGGHNYLVLAADGSGMNIEAMPTRRHATRLTDAPLVHANHCLAPETQALERERLPASMNNSVARQADAERLLDAPHLTVDDLKAVTADQASICRVGVAPTFVGTCGAVVMLPATRELWVVGGRPSEGEYRRLALASRAA